ncbi:K+/H+ antiporter subunit F [Rhodocyclaceae bacterium]
MNALLPLVLPFAVNFALACFALAMLCALIRLLIGPAAQDRILALDTLYINGMLIILMLGIGLGAALYFDIALLIALFGFVGSTALAKFLLRGEVIEP